MFIVIIIAALAAWGAIATVVELRRDGYRAVPTDWTRVAERDLSALTQASSHASYR